MAENGQSDAPTCETPKDEFGRPEPKHVMVRSLGALFLWALVVLLALRYFSAVKFTVLAALGAAALTAVLRPVSDRLPGPAGLRAGLSVLGALLLLAGLLTLLGWLLAEPIANSIEEWPLIRRNINQELEDIGQELGVNGRLDVDRVIDMAGRVFTGGQLTSWLSSVIDKAITTLLALLVVLISAVYLLAQRPGKLLEPASKLLPPRRQGPTLQAIRALGPQLRWWALGTLSAMIVIGLTSGLGYWMIGLRFALPLAIFAGLTQVVPTFGPMVTLAVSMLIAATQGAPQVLGVLGVYAVVQTLESYVLTPLVMRKAVNVPPIVTIFTVILWGNIFGLPGLLLAIPLDLTVWALLKHHLIQPHEDLANGSG